MARGRIRDGGEAYPIHTWQQLYHTLRTQVTSIHHNVSAALAETFGVAWCPSGEPVWLLGRRYEPEPKDEARALTRISQPSGDSSVNESYEDESSDKTAMPIVVDGNVGEEGKWSCEACSFLNHHLLHYCEMCGTLKKASHSSSAMENVPRITEAETDKGSNGVVTVPHKPPDEFIEAWSQIPRMTYRKGFAPMYRCVKADTSVGEEEVKRQYVQLTSDAGWGCMIRVGQMQLATALKRHQEFFASGGCSTPSADKPQPSQVEMLHPIEQKFLDDKRSPFSIFRFIEAALGREVTATIDKGSRLHGAARANGAPHAVHTRQLTKKDAGDWFGPTTISETIAALVEQSPVLCGSLAVYVNVDGMLYEDEVRSLAYGDGEISLPTVQPAFIERIHRCSGSGDSDEEFTVVSNAPVMSATTLLLSPQLSTATQSPTAVNLETGSELDELRDLQLPPPVVETDVEFSIAEESPRAQQRSEAYASEGPSPRWRKAVLLLFPKRLGLEKNVSKYYVNAVLRYFELKTSLGAMGGRPRMAHFFVGRQDRNLLYVDPHVVQPAALPVTEGEGSDVGFVGANTFRNVPTVQAIPIEHIDSSVSFAFYCSSEEDLAELIKDIHAIDRDEEDALIRCEPERPPELRGQQVSRAETWLGCENDSLSHEFPEVVGDFCNEVMELSGESPKAMNNRNSESSFEFCDNNTSFDATMEIQGEDVDKVQVIEPSCSDGYHSTPTISVGSAWACIEASS